MLFLFESTVTVLLLLRESESKVTKLVDWLFVSKAEPISLPQKETPGCSLFGGLEHPGFSFWGQSDGGKLATLAWSQRQLKALERAHRWSEWPINTPTASTALGETRVLQHFRDD